MPNPDFNPQSFDSTDILEKQKYDYPGKFKVLIYNDNYTTMEFVISILTGIFNKDIEEATNLMLKVHKNGWAAVGTYTREVAETKILKAEGEARINSYPLKLTMEKV